MESSLTLVTADLALKAQILSVHRHRSVPQESVTPTGILQRGREKPLRAAASIVVSMGALSNHCPL